MAKLIRCPSGHVFDSEAHASCPECARTEVPEAEAGAAQDTDSGGGSGKTGRPINPLMVWGCAAVALIAAGFFMLRPTPSYTPTADPGTEAEFKECMDAVDRQACDRAIASGKFEAGALAQLYKKRGFLLLGQRDIDAALSDLNEVVKFAPNDALTLAGRAGAYVQKHDLEHAIQDLEQSIRIDPNIYYAYIARAGYFATKGDYTSAIADYRKALTYNLEPGSREAVEKAIRVLAAGQDEPASTQAEAPSPQASQTNQTPSSAPAAPAVPAGGGALSTADPKPAGTP